MSEHGHPQDALHRAAAANLDCDTLIRLYEQTVRDEDICVRAGGLEAVACSAIAVALRFERQLAYQDQRVRRQLYPRGGRVDNIVPFKRPTKEAPAPSHRPGA